MLTPEKRARMVMVAAFMGSIGTVLLALAIVFHWPDFLRGMAMGVLVASLFFLLRRKLRDEYFEGLWAAGTSWSFVAVVLWTTLVPLYIGTFEGQRGAVWVPDISANWTFIVALAAFFTGFHAKHFGGRS